MDTTGTTTQGDDSSSNGVTPITSAPGARRKLGRDMLLGRDDSVYETVFVPEWEGGVEVCVRGLTAGERDTYEMSMLRTAGKTQRVVYDDMRAKLIALTVVDSETHEPLFTLDDVPALTKLSARAVQRIYDVALRLSGITEKDQDELVKNSERVRSVVSSSGSQSTPSASASTT